MDPKNPNEDPQGVKDETGAPPAPASQEPPQEPAAQPAPAPVADPSKGGGVTPAGKTYTEAEVNRMMHDRTKDFSATKKSLEAYAALGTPEEIAAKLKGPTPPPASGPQLDDDDKKLKEYMLKLYPELKELSKLGKLDDQQLAFVDSLRQREVEAGKEYLTKAESEIDAHCAASKIEGDDKKALLRDMVAVVITSNPTLASRFQARDASVVGEALKMVSGFMGAPTAASPSPLAAAQAAAAAKTKGAQIKAPIPPGGIGAPLTKDRKKTEEERLDDAFKAIQKQP